MQQLLSPIFNLLNGHQSVGAIVPFDPLKVFIIIVLLAALLKVLAGRAGYSLSDLTQKAILTPNEQEFFGRLCRALPEYHVFPQVALNALIKTKGFLSKRAFYSLRRRFESKVVDYVVCERGTFRVIAIIELDDKTHSAEKDNKRDTLLTAAGYKTVRFQSKAKPSEAQIAEVFRVRSTS